MNTNRGRGGRPQIVNPRGRPPSVMSGRSVPSPEVRLPAPPVARPPAPADLVIRDREDVRMEIEREVHALPRHDTPVSGFRPADPLTRRGPSSRELLRRALSTPDAARQGFLLREVLGPPVSLRIDTHDRPS